MSSANSKLPNLGSKTEEFITELEEVVTTPLFELTPQEARAFLDELQKKSYKEIPANVVDRTVLTKCGNVDLRIVRPQNNNEKLPVIIYVHGGGWVMGGKESYDMFVRKLANGTNCVVVFPDYSRSPEAKYPVALDQICGVLEYVYKNSNEFNVNENKMIVAGDSAGGNMATVAALKMKNSEVKLIFQCLLYPVTNADMDTESYKHFADGPWLTKKAMEWFWEAYVPDREIRKEPYVSPLMAEIEELRGLPPALIVTDENDVLCDEGEAYARKLDMAGIEVLNIRTNGTIHDFLLLNALAETPQAKGTMDFVCCILKNVLHN